VYLVNNMQQPQASVHYVDKERSESKPLCTESYNKNLCFVNVSDIMQVATVFSGKHVKRPKTLLPLRYYY
jgi:hypothetical protein